MKRVIVESPYKGQVPVNEIYGELCMHDCLVNHNEAPFASHLLYTRLWVLRDDVPEQRELGINAGFFWRDVAEKTVFYMDRGLTKGMQLGILDCVEKKKPYELRSVPEDLWHRFEVICMTKDYGKPERVLKKDDYNQPWRDFNGR